MVLYGAGNGIWSRAVLSGQNDSRAQASVQPTVAKMKGVTTIFRTGSDTMSGQDNSKMAEEN